MHIRLLLEEPSAEALLKGLLPRLVPAGATWDTLVFQGKRDLLNNLESRLKSLRKWIPVDWRILVLVDEDRQDCRKLKQELEKAARAAGFPTKSSASGSRFTVINRIAIEELEAWYFGDEPALAKAFPGVSRHLCKKAAFRDPDAIAGGTWEALERTLRLAGYYPGGLPKIEVAKIMGHAMDPRSNRSASFRQFTAGLSALIGP